MTEAELIRHFERTLGDLKAQRLTRESEWRQISDYFFPRKDFTITARPMELRRRRLASSVPAVAATRCAGMLAAYLVDPSQPFIRPNVERGLVAAGRPTGVEAASADYLENLAWQLFDRMMEPKSGFLASVSRVCLELVGFGTGVMWTGRKRGFGPRYQARPLRSCWIDENDDGEVDTLYYEFTLPLWRAKQRFPLIETVPGYDREDPAKDQEPVCITHVVEPRQGGAYGAVRQAKPFRECYVLMEKRVILEEGGYDSFPFAVPRLGVEPGSVYGTGLCWHVLPDAMVHSRLQEMVERGVSLRIDPILMAPSRMFGKPLDRRAGALNYYDPAGLGFMDARTALQRLDIGGDVNVGRDYMLYLTQNIEQGLFTDWMRLRETGQMTAEEVIERRDLRLRAMSSFIPGVDRDLMGASADRTLEIMTAEGQLPAAPREIAGLDVGWDYAGPLARAQQQRTADGIGRLFEQMLLAAKLDPSAVYVMDVAESIRTLAEAWGAAPGSLRSRAEVARRRQADAEKQDAMDSLAAVQGGATALRDGGQGLMTLAAAQPDSGGQLPQAA